MTPARPALVLRRWIVPPASKVPHLSFFLFFFLVKISVRQIESVPTLKLPLRPQATSWTRRVPAWCSVRLVPTETPRPTFVKNVRPTVNPARGTATTASAAPKVATNCISTRGAVGPIVQSKMLKYCRIKNTMFILCATPADIKGSVYCS